jgi:hypothetical protein
LQQPRARQPNEFQEVAAPDCLRPGRRFLTHGALWALDATALLTFSRSRRSSGDSAITAIMQLGPECRHGSYAAFRPMPTIDQKRPSSDDPHRAE